VPAVTPVVGRLIVGLPPAPVPFVTVTVLEPVMATRFTVVPLTAKKPVPVVAARLDIIPLSEIVGLPVLPSGLEMESPVPTPIETLVRVLVLVLACRPTPEVTNESKAPVGLTRKEPCAPPSVKDKPFPAAKYLLFGKLTVLFTVK
jgi:hypothetical protein